MANERSSNASAVPTNERVILEEVRKSILVNDTVTPPLPSSVTSSTGQIVTVPANGNAPATGQGGS